MKRITCMLIASAIILSAALCGCSDENNNSSSSQAVTAATDTTVKTTGNKIHINDSTLGEIWIIELDGVPVNKLDNNNFSADSNLKYYNENG